MHRDIKPENLLLSVGEKGELLNLKIADFGMVCEFGQQTRDYDFGTMGYQAPESLLRQRYDE